MKMLASDIDGTFVFEDENGKKFVSDEVVQAINRFRSEGNLFGVCTGRGFATAHHGFENVPVDFYITNTGACIFNGQGDVLQSNTIPVALAKQIISEVEGAWFIIQDRTAMYVIGKSLSNGKTISSLDEVSLTTIDGFGSIFDDEAMAHKYCQKIKDKYGDIVSVYQNATSFDTQALGCSKGVGLLKAAELLQVDEFYCIGDSYNDIAMLEITDNSYTFYSSPEVVREAAGHCVNNFVECIEEILNEA